MAQATISFRCPTCSARIKAPVQLIGEKRPCPSCHRPFTVRVQPPQDAGPLFFSEEDDEQWTKQAG